MEKEFMVEHFKNFKTEDGLNILYLNIRSMKNKISQLEAFVESQNHLVHVIALTETWINDETTRNSLNLKNYKSYHSIRKKLGGGVSLMVLNSLLSDELLEAEYLNGSFLIIFIRELKVKIGVIYKPPNTNQNDFLTKLDEILESNENLLICGDFNINLVKKNEKKCKKIYEYDYLKLFCYN
jgi:exonuclease III